MPFIMLTARADEGSVVQAKEIGVDAYLVKPFAPIQLEKKLLTLVAAMKTP
ncbi:MAG: response regulator, partial [Rhodospirillales bacterium]